MQKHKQAKQSWPARLGKKLKGYWRSSPLIFIGTICFVLIILMSGGFGIYHHVTHNAYMHHLQRIERVSQRKQREMVKNRAPQSQRKIAKHHSKR